MLFPDWKEHYYIFQQYAAICTTRPRKQWLTSVKYRVKLMELLFVWEKTWPLSFPGERRWKKSCFPCVTYIGLLEVLAEVLICKQWTKLDLRIREIQNDKCRIASVVAGGCQLRLGTNPRVLVVPWLPSWGKNKDFASRQGWWMDPGSMCTRSSYVI